VTPDASPPERQRRSTAAVETFYGRWAGLYDVIARRFPRVAAVRRAVADACRLGPGDTVVEMGCGTGANVPYLRDRVAPGGRVVGVDVTEPGLRRARRRLRRPAADDGVTVEFVRADATTPPVAGPVDAVVGTFVSGMVAEPAAVVDGWCDLAADGHVVLADAAPSRRPVARPLNALFRAATVVSTPPTTRLRYDRDLLASLTERVDAAHETVRRRATATATGEYLLGFVRLTGGRV
jgi:SAM-dependent methyltransferase